MAPSPAAVPPLPEAFLSRMRRMLGDEYEAFLKSYEEPPAQALYLNTLKRDAPHPEQACDTADSSLRGEDCNSAPATLSGFHLTPVPWAAGGYYYAAEDAPGRHPFHAAGVYYIQEPSAMAAVSLLSPRPGERILDLCAAPGGKSVQIACAMRGDGLLVSNEIHPARAKILSQNMERTGVRNALVLNETPERLAERFPEYFDRILTDAPCSGEGMFRKDVQARAQWSEENVAMCAKRQAHILEAAAKMLRPGGLLVYSTCTFSTEENEENIHAFLAAHAEFRPVPADPCSQTPPPPFAASVYGRVREATGLPIARAVWSPITRAAESPITRVAVSPVARAAEISPGGIPGTFRLWPHRLRGEGHFIAVLQKTFHPQDMRLAGTGGNETATGTDGLLSAWQLFCAQNFHTFPEEKSRQLSFDNARLLPFGNRLYLAPADLPPLDGLKALRPGLELGELRKGRFIPSHALALALSPYDAVRVWNLSADSADAAAYLHGLTLSLTPACNSDSPQATPAPSFAAPLPARNPGSLPTTPAPSPAADGWTLVVCGGYSLGWGYLVGNTLKNHYPKGLRLTSMRPSQ